MGPSVAKLTRPRKIPKPGAAPFGHLIAAAMSCRCVAARLVHAWCRCDIVVAVPSRVNAMREKNKLFLKHTEWSVCSAAHWDGLRASHVWRSSHNQKRT